MRFFELHFNPRYPGKTKTEPESVFNSFLYRPENIYEKRFGYLSVTGELKNVLPQNLKFLDNLALFVRKNYYSAPIKFSPEASLRESLKKANEHLQGIAKKGDVSWLGNLQLAILNLSPSQKKKCLINFTKLGNIRILLLRRGRIIDIGKNLEFSEIEPYPLKIFGNIVSGKISENDVVLVLTEEVFSAFSKGSALSTAKKKIKGPANFLQKIAGIEPFEEEKLKQLLKSHEKELLKISGACLICSVSELSTRESKSLRPIIFRQKPEKFSFSRAFSPLLKLVRKSSFRKFLKAPGLSFPRLSFPRLSFSKLSFSRPSFLKIPSFKLRFLPVSKKLITVFLFLLFLLLGFFLFKEERKEELEFKKEVLEQVKSKKLQAESLLILKDEEQANLLFQEAWREILPQTKADSPFREEALSLKNSIEESLLSLNKLEEISEPELFFEFKRTELEFVPQKILFFQSQLYVFNPFSSTLYKLNVKEKRGEIFEAGKNLKLAAVVSDSVLFFANPNFLIFFKNDEWQERGLEQLSGDFSFNKFSGFKSDAFFLDDKTGEIAKYSMLSVERIPGPQLWLSPKTKKPLGSKSMAVDGLIWILTETNEIDRYFGGFYEKTLKINLFPFFKNPTKIYTSELLPYLYILEPNQSRLVILTKEGKAVKQWHSEEFDNLLDFAVSSDGKTVWLLNGLKIYKVNL